MVGAVGFGLLGAVSGLFMGYRKGEVVTYTFIDYQDGTNPNKLKVQSILYNSLEQQADSPPQI